MTSALFLPIALALDLCVPPVALLVLCIGGMTLCAALLTVLTGRLAPALLAGMASLLLAGAIGLAWWRHGRHALGARHLLMALFYIFWKIPLYMRFFFHRQVAWVRSKRDNES